MISNLVKEGNIYSIKYSNKGSNIIPMLALNYDSYIKPLLSFIRILELLNSLNYTNDQKMKFTSFFQFFLIIDKSY